MDFTTNPRTSFKDAAEMSKEEARAEARALREGIDHHDHVYYAAREAMDIEGLGEEAKRHAVRIIDEAEFKRMMSGR